ncbi:30S ribosome-binding factor RbfA [Candidatus Erwinia haradaeae]|uniref:Ribosome-binding factor A n=1 Tax=Candidatus Erwinia haradaeae TaxID=1922217 RepID=A0A803FUX4_9GAMM|nr:30S ribosome-binding factor RbfA [Candidatus Erwinia haradaeae]VFP88560.1 30S ribosome-binding factor [Candidatus Erwinia haradaeae]
MEKECGRLQRISQELHREIAVILQSEIQDPRLNIMVTVSGVDVSRDLSHAKVFVTFLNEKEDTKIQIRLIALSRASGYIRGLLSKIMKFRVIPRLTFYHDNSMIEGERMSNLISSLVSRDINRRDLAERNKEEGHLDL